ncbi:phenylpropionate dioxygenase-like ring-hydroxylating dioxygenase large terminal subunit [Sphingomonas vulcanisoli]|uniref:Phenylpropionate dioxygenase-like ring-hydroxylating dioxygenase large terminal subunit n=1 Tax=Sphingomonas vulcanisoli TaxID=1658060 RepID=A0ABX0TUN1_9SPHN|nr:aromatic ring-hydroxylating dioxygenase subunit alpha [Sphingomonas vulcanisoli]NIJ09223.1 phenylpropionate dioxygenase-like ring-hydroxylating dioxygenase large terminal subunit [Sphingomonas vulcanisoli]
MLKTKAKSRLPEDFHDLVDPEQATVDRSIFSDEEIYKLELERIFARGWNFMCHESQIPKPGDFFLSFIGDDSVIATRDKTGKLQVFLNTCRHRGNAVCRAEQGHTKSFLCTYHGWTYGLDGKLIGVPGYKDFYHEDLDRSQWGLVAAPHVESYKGFVFACMDPDAPNLNEFLGPVGRIGLDLIAERGRIVPIDGIKKNIIGCNWKLAVDNAFDYYHAPLTHASTIMVRNPRVDKEGNALPPRANSSANDHRVMLGSYGHAISGPKVSETERSLAALLPDHKIEPRVDLAWRDKPETLEAMGPAGIEINSHPNIFPNMWVTESSQVALRIPRGPRSTEVWWFSFVDADLSDERQKAYVEHSNFLHGPSGMNEQEDGENWDQSTRGTASILAKNFPLNYAMNRDRGEVKFDNAGVAYIDTHVNEHAQLWMYMCWADWMTAPDWSSLKQRHESPPTDRF